jgi:hypothetical protein
MRRESKGSTYHSFAIGEATAIGGRFATVSKAKVVGSSASVEYPKLPATSSWHEDPVPAEMPLGWSVNEMPVFGEADGGAELPSEASDVSASGGAGVAAGAHRSGSRRRSTPRGS